MRERTRVTGILAGHGPGVRTVTGPRAVKGVRTDHGDVEAEVVVNCAGQWAKQVGAMAGVTVPLHSAEHFYVVTEQVDGVHRDFPILRDPDGYTYIKEEVGGLVVGGFEPDAKPWVAPDALPYPFEFQLLDEDWDHFEILMDSAIARIPVLAETGIKMFYNGPESFTPDNQFILGEAPELRNFFVAAGFNSVGIASAGGAGRALAEWITSGEPGLDLSAVDIRRFARFNGNNQWLHDRVSEVLGLHYAVPWPNRELASARPFRRSPASASWPRGGRAGPLRRPRRRLVSLVLADPGPETMIWGGELVLPDGAAVGQVTSGAWGETVGGCVGLAYLRHPDGRVLTPDLIRTGDYQVNVGGHLYPATVQLRPPFDPAGHRIKGRYDIPPGPPAAPR